MPVGSTPEVQAAQSDAWAAGFAYAALLHDVGKVAVDLDIKLLDGSVWHPWHGPMTQPYRFRYRSERQYRLHGAAAGLLSRQILDEPILDWLSRYPAVWEALLYVLAGQMEHAGLLGELIIKADQASVAQAMGGDPVRAITAPKHALQRKLLDGLRYLVREVLKLNQKEASDGWLTDEALWLVSKTVADKLRAHLLSQGITGIPENNLAVFDVLQEHGIVQANGEGKAIWTARVTSNNGWSNTLTFLKLSPALIWDSTEPGSQRPASFAGSVTSQATPIDTPVAAEAPQTVTTHATAPSIADTSGLDTLLDLLGTQRYVTSAEPDTAPASHVPESVPVVASPAMPDELLTQQAPSSIQAPGEHFIAWLRDGVLNRKLIMNDARALVHTVDSTLYLVSPGLFMRYMQAFPDYSAQAKREGTVDWVWAQKQFEQLRLHRKQANGLNIWVCTVVGPRKTRQVNGYLLKDPTVILPEVPINNPYLQINGNPQ